MAYTPTTWVEGVTTLGPTNMNKIETELVYLDARIAPAALAYGTTLPGSPVDGQEAILVDSTTNPSYQWRFRYNAGSTSAYKWESVGGSDLSLASTTDASNTIDNTWEAAATPTWTIPRSGEYLCSAQAANHVTALPVNYNALLLLGFWTAGAATSGLGISNGPAVGAVTQSDIMAIVLPTPLTLVGGNTLQPAINSSAHAYQISRFRQLVVKPKRVS
jgi:hypothetical protein